MPESKVEEVKGPEFYSTYKATSHFYKLMAVNGYFIPKTIIRKIFYFLYSGFIISFGTFYLPAALTITMVNTEIRDLSVFFTSLQVTFNCYGGFFKLIPFVFMILKLKATHEVLDRLDVRCNDEEEIAEQKRAVRIGRIMTIVNTVVYLTYCSSTTLGSIVIGRTPYSIYFPGMDWHNSLKERIYATGMEYFLMDLACLQHAMTDTYPVIYVVLLSGHVNILATRIRKLGVKKELTDKEMVEELKRCFKDHKTIIELQEIVSPMISATIFIQFSLTAVMIGTTLINITFFSTTVIVRMGSVAYIGAVTAQFLPICYFAQALQDECDNLTDTIFHSSWIGRNLKYQKMLVVFMARSQRTLEFTAGKLFPINLASFLKIGKFSFSLFALMRNMDFGGKYGLGNLNK